MFSPCKDKSRYVKIRTTVPESRLSFELKEERK